MSDPDSDTDIDSFLDRHPLPLLVRIPALDEIRPHWTWYVDYEQLKRFYAGLDAILRINLTDI